MENSSFCVASSKDFEILDLDPPNNHTSHYGACHFGYNLALSKNINLYVAVKEWKPLQIQQFNTQQYVVQVFQKN